MINFQSYLLLSFLHHTDTLHKAHDSPATALARCLYASLQNFFQANLRLQSDTSKYRPTAEIENETCFKAVSKKTIDWSDLKLKGEEFHVGAFKPKAFRE